MPTLPESPLSLTRPIIGLGCATFGGTISVAESIRVIQAAVEGGVRHLDVARSYGYGQAEEAVGRFLRSGAGQSVTVTTKVGIRPPGGLRQVRALRTIARAVADLSPAAKRRIVRAASAGVASSRFGPADLMDSLASSLKALQVDRVDVLLLHECGPEDVTDEVLGWLGDRVAAGEIGTWGIATGAERAEPIVAAVPVPVVQIPASVTDTIPTALLHREGALIRHSALRGALRPLTLLLEQAGRRALEEERLGLALGPDDLAEVLLRLALAAAPGGPVLVGTRRSEHARVLGRIRPLPEDAVLPVLALVREAGATAVR